jgi:hypothetical protein
VASVEFDIPTLHMGERVIIGPPGQRSNHANCYPFVAA